MASETIRPPRAAEDGGREVGQDVGRVLLGAEAEPSGARTGEGDRRERGEEVGDEQDHGGGDRGPAGGAVAVHGLLVEGDQGVPAPVDEQAQEHGLGERAEVVEAEGVDPAQGRGGGAVTGEGGDPEGEQGEELEGEHRVLRVGGEPDAPVGDGHDQGDQEDGDGGHGEGAAGRAVEPEEGEQRGGPDLGERGHREDGRDQDRPTARDPADGRAERPGVPDEGRAAVRHPPVQFPEREGREEDRHEAQDQGGRGPVADDEGHEAQGDRDAVRGGDGGEPEGDRREKTDGVSPQTLAEGWCRSG